MTKTLNALLDPLWNPFPESNRSETAPTLLCREAGLLNCDDVFPARLGVFETDQGDFLLDSVLGQGGMGIVFEARAKDGSRVALKTIQSSQWSSEELLGHFERETACLSRLDAPGIVKMVSRGIGEGDIPFIALELIEGYSLRRLLKTAGKFSLDSILDLVTAVTAALNAVHGAGIIHCDIKPDNLLIDFKGQPWLVDFGVGVRLAEDRAIPVGGTLDYMPVEQVFSREVDHRADQHALAVTVFELMTGMVPDLQVRRGVHCPDEISPELLAVLRQGMAAKPSDRHPSLNHFRDALDFALAPYSFDVGKVW